MHRCTVLKATFYCSKLFAIGTQNVILHTICHDLIICCSRSRCQRKPHSMWCKEANAYEKYDSLSFLFSISSFCNFVWLLVCVWWVCFVCRQCFPYSSIVTCRCIKRTVGNWHFNGISELLKVFAWERASVGAPIFLFNNKYSNIEIHSTYLRCICMKSIQWSLK